MGDVAGSKQSDSSSTAGQTDEKFGSIVNSTVDEACPGIVVEASRGCLARRVVVELDPDLIKLSLLQDGLHLEVSISLRALRSSSKYHVLTIGLDKLAKVFHHANIWLLVI